MPTPRRSPAAVRTPVPADARPGDDLSDADIAAIHDREEAAHRARLAEIAASVEERTGVAIDVDRLIDHVDTGAAMEVAPGILLPARTAAPSAPPAPLVPGWTADRQRAFIDHLSTNGCVSHAARAVGLSKQSAYQLRDRRPNGMFALAWDVAIHRARRLLLDEATERALAGREVPVFRRGEEVGTRVVHNDRLLMFLVGLKRGPAHPSLAEHEVAELWPTILDQIDATLPSAFAADRSEVLDDD